MAKASSRKSLSASQRTDLLNKLTERFHQNMSRHPDVAWEDVLPRLTAAPEKLWSLAEMERTGGEPDVVGSRSENGTFLFMDCAAETPAGRRSLCFDEAALNSRKANKPEGSAGGLATAMGIALLTEADYQVLQSQGEFDQKTSSWLWTPEVIRSRGGALFGDRRYGHVFTYHNGAESYYAVRGFRGKLDV